MTFLLCDIKGSGAFLTRKLSGVHHECGGGAGLISYQETGSRLEMKKLSFFASKLAGTKA